MIIKIELLQDWQWTLFKSGQAQTGKISAVATLAVQRPSDLSSILGTSWWKERLNSTKLSLIAIHAHGRWMATHAHLFQTVIIRNSNEVSYIVKHLSFTNSGKTSLSLCVDGILELVNNIKETMPWHLAFVLFFFFFFYKNHNQKVNCPTERKKGPFFCLLPSRTRKVMKAFRYLC